MHRHDGRAVAVFLLLAGIYAAAAARAQTGTLMVADFDQGKLETIPGLAVIAMTDEQLGGTSDARFTLIQPGAAGSPGALRISFRITDDFRSPFAGAWTMLGAEGLATDLTEYRGLRFHARSTKGAFLAGIGQFSGRPSLHMAPFEAGSEWTVVELPFDRFLAVTPSGAPLPKGEPLVPRHAVSVTFNASPELRGPFDLDVDQLQLYR